MPLDVLRIICGKVNGDAVTGGCVLSFTVHDWKGTIVWVIPCTMSGLSKLYDELYLRLISTRSQSVSPRIDGHMFCGSPSAVMSETRKWASLYCCRYQLATASV